MIYVLVPGAWTGAWIWDRVVSRLSRKGRSVHAITLSGLKCDEHAANVSLDQHVRNVVHHLESNGLTEVVLVGHSYSGFVVGQVAARLPERVCHTVFVEAFLPIDGKSLIEVSGLDWNSEISLIEKHSGLWPPPTRDELEEQPHLTSDLVELLASRMVGHPGKTVTDPAVLPKPLSSMRSTFIASEGWLAHSREAALVDSLKHEPLWTFRGIEGGHWPMLTVPDQLADLLDEISMDPESASQEMRSIRRREDQRDSQ